MSYVNVKYKGNSISQFIEGSKILETSGKYCEDNIQIRFESSQNDVLFHFDDNMLNYGKTQAMISDITGMELSDAHHKFGTHSLRCGSTQLINNLPILSNMDFQSYDFTLDFWVFPTNLRAYASGVACVPFSTAYRSLSVYLYTDRITLGVTSRSGSWDFDEIPGNANLSNNTWYHIAIVRSGSKIYLFLNGVKTIEINYGTNAIAKSYPFTLGSNTYGNGDRRFDGYIDEFRYIRGVAVWTEDFTPPTEPYV